MVAVKGDCIIGSQIQGNGYARIRTAAGRQLAHRVVWERERGPIPPGHQIHHRCGTKGCINVDHLELLTADEHGRLHPRPVKCQHPERTTRPSGRGYCPVCEREWKRNGAANRRAQRRLRYETDPVYRARRLEENRRYREANRDG